MGCSASGHASAAPPVIRAPVEPVLGSASYIGPQDPVTFSVCNDEEQATFSVCHNEEQATDLRTLIWLPGSGQRPDNELIRRLVNALHEAGSRNLVVQTLPSNAGAVEAMLARTPGPVFLGGHSAGGALAAMLYSKPWGLQGVKLQSKYPALVGLITVNAVSGERDLELPSLVVIGENDGGRRLLPDSQCTSIGTGQWPNEDELVFVIPEGPVSVLIARQGDHSLRYNAGDKDKDECRDTPETHAMNLMVARAMLRYMEEPVRSWRNRHEQPGTA